MTGPRLTELAAISLAMLLLAACNSGPQGVRFLNGTDQASQAQPIRSLTGDEIKLAIVGKTFQYTRADGNGQVATRDASTMKSGQRGRA